MRLGTARRKPAERSVPWDAFPGRSPMSRQEAVPSERGISEMPLRPEPARGASTALGRRKPEDESQRWGSHSVTPAPQTTPSPIRAALSIPRTPLIIAPPFIAVK